MNKFLSSINFTLYNLIGSVIHMTSWKNELLTNTEVLYVIKKQTYLYGFVQVNSCTEHMCPLDGAVCI